SGTITITPSTEDMTLAEAVSSKALPSVVSIDVYMVDSQLSGPGSGSSESVLAGLGSGIIITDDGYILTNYHVIEGSSDLIVNVDDEEYTATVVGTDSSSDLAVLKIDASGLTPIEIGSSSDLKVGEWVMALGSPFGLEKSVSTGIVSALYRSTSMENSTGLSIYANMIQTDAAVNPGNSGGALVDSEGKLIGINTLIESYSGSSSGVGFAIPVDYAMKVAEQLMAGKTVSHAYLGVSLGTVNSQNAVENGLSVDSGAYVAEVVSGTPAAQAGLAVGDVLTKVNGVSIASASEFIIQIRSYSPGDKVELEYVRGTDTKTVEVTLGSDTDADEES
ncbi:MAG: PDZ domain-containing protein, partial [Actinobacteria bacterium]|nr:PDZ domain-containing protein [Actinomycetota bacterium]